MVSDPTLPRLIESADLGADAEAVIGELLTRGPADAALIVRGAALLSAAEAETGAECLATSTEARLAISRPGVVPDRPSAGCTWRSDHPRASPTAASIIDRRGTARVPTRCSLSGPGDR